MNATDNVVSTHAKGFAHFYTLWSLVALSDNLPTPVMLASRYAAFMQKVETLAQQQDLSAFLAQATPGEYTLAQSYLTNSRGASTDLGPRRERLEALKNGLLSQ